jgi:hypothetical protein
MPALTYALLIGPTNATLNATNGVFTWRPLLSQANSVNEISVQAAVSGVPALSATNSFEITVNPVVAPGVSASVSAGRVNLVMSGAPGPDYTLLVSSNLTGWQVLWATNSPMLPAMFVDTNMGNLPARFYRAQIGP